jgi:hypothetical protein
MATAHQIEPGNLIDDQEIGRLLIICLNSGRMGPSNSIRNPATISSLHPHRESTNVPPPVRFIRKNKSPIRPPSGPGNPLVDGPIEPCSVQSRKPPTFSEASHAYDFILESLLQPDYSVSIDLLPPEGSTTGDLNTSLDRTENPSGVL